MNHGPNKRVTMDWDAFQMKCVIPIHKTRVKTFSSSISDILKMHVFVLEHKEDYNMRIKKLNSGKYEIHYQKK